MGMYYGGGREPSTFRIGQGFDLHKLQPGLPFWLGGVKLDFNMGSVAHSDGDVLLHAITDALLGAAGLGDIGELFPSTDPKWKNAQSNLFVSQAVLMCTQNNYKVVNVDATVLLEKPSLSPHKKAIVQNVARLLQVLPDQVSLKAKTMEQLGPIGQGQAIAAMVSLILTKSGGR